MSTRNRRRKGWRILIGIVALWIIGHILYITIDGLWSYQGNADIAVVLGNRVYCNGSLSPVLQGRVEEALALYRQGRVPRIMVSGGRGVDSGDCHYPEGTAMKAYLVRHGVPADRIIEDNEGWNTYLTAKNFIPVADSLHVRSAIAVSSFYHLTRTKYIFRKLGFEHVHGASSRSFHWNDLVGLPRDVVAFYKYVLIY